MKEFPLKKYEDARIYLPDEGFIQATYWGRLLYWNQGQLDAFNTLDHSDCIRVEIFGALDLKIKREVIMSGTDVLETYGKFKPRMPIVHFCDSLDNLFKKIE